VAQGETNQPWSSRRSSGWTCQASEGSDMAHRCSPSEW